MMSQGTLCQDSLLHHLHNGPTFCRDNNMLRGLSESFHPNLGPGGTALITKGYELHPLFVLQAYC